MDAVDFKLTRGTMIRGTVTVGPGNQPLPNQYIRLDERGGPAPKDLREMGDRWSREVRRQFGATTDFAGHYSVRVGPGTYTLMGPPRTKDEKITVKDQAELVRDFGMPRPEKGTLTGRVVFSGGEGKAVAGARIEILAQNPVDHTGCSDRRDSLGRFQAERLLDPLVVHARKQPTESSGQLSEVARRKIPTSLSQSPRQQQRADCSLTESVDDPS